MISSDHQQKYIFHCYKAIVQYTMRISILTLFPQMIKSFLSESIVKRAQEKGTVEIKMINMRDFAIDAYGTVDDRPYGGGAGMVLRVDVVKKAIDEAKKYECSNTRVILTSARGTTYTQPMAKSYSTLDHLIIICGHYEGIDERISYYIDEEISIGDVVLTGGEIPAAAICDSIVRLLPGTLKKDEATQEESFGTIALDEVMTSCGRSEKLHALKQEGYTDIQLLEYPHYTRPPVFDGHEVPEIVMRGDHGKIRTWRIQQAYQITQKKRPDLLDKSKS